MSVSASTIVTGVAGSPISHSLSPILHNAWIEAANLDAVYVAFEPRDFDAFARGLTGGAIRGLNVTSPYKRQALQLADIVSLRAARAEAANLLLFGSDGQVRADNTDTEGLLAALAEQAPSFDPAAGPALILGAGGAARGVVAALVQAGAPVVRIANRSPQAAQALANSFTGRVEVVDGAALADALAAAHLVVNATSTSPDIPFEQAPGSAVAMDMVYRPLATPFLARARAAGLRTVDGLAMLIGQARPSFEALFGVATPDIDVRALSLAALEDGS